VQLPGDRHLTVREHSDRRLPQNPLRGPNNADGSCSTTWGWVLDDNHIVPTNGISRLSSRSRDSSLILRYTRQNGEADSSSQDVQAAIGAITCLTGHCARPGAGRNERAGKREGECRRSEIQRL
jgi:hypothetical protein